MLRAGDTLGRYRILARMRSGGMATLYLGARDGAAGFARPVAIKIIHPHLARDAKLQRMFIDEARLAAKVDHPNVVRTDEFGEENGSYYLVLEYVDGCSLAELVRELGKRQRRLGLELAVKIALDVASGLHAAHEATGDDGKALDIVHRDVSPQNILLAFKGHVKLIDFGLAKTRARIEATQQGIVGKIAYMPPEQAHSQPLDRRADIYALGVVLWEMLTTRRLFEANSQFALLAKVRAPQVEPPSKYAPNIPKELDRVVMKALAPEANDRYLTAEAFRVDLARAVPAALERSASELEALIVYAMAEHIKAARARLAGLGASVPSEPEIAPPAEATVESLTESLDVPTVLYATGAERRGAPAVLFVVAGMCGALLLGMAFLLFQSSEPPRAAVFPPPPVLVTATGSEPEAALPRASVSAPEPEPAPRLRPKRPLQTRSTPARTAPSSRVIMIDGIPVAEKP
jgi:serine/threonine-protein kinase